MQSVLDYSVSHVSSVSFTELLSVDEAREHCRDLEGREDGLLLRQIQVARIKVEKDCRRSFVAHTVDFAYDSFPCERFIRLIGYTPLVSVTHLKYIDQDGTLQTWSSANYEVDEARDAIWLAYNVDWPTVRDIQNAVQIRAIFGHVSTDEELAVAKQATLLLVANFFKEREPVLVGSISKPLELNYMALIDTIAARSYP